MTTAERQATLPLLDAAKDRARARASMTRLYCVVWNRGEYEVMSVRDAEWLRLTPDIVYVTDGN